MISTLAADRLAKLRALPRAAMLLWLAAPAALPAFDSAPPLPAPGSQELVFRALNNEISAAHDAAHPMQYRLRKSSPRLTSTKVIVETRDGAVARLLTINDTAPPLADRQKDDARLDTLLADPARQRKRKQREQDDTGRALKVLRALPKAFLYSTPAQKPSAPSPWKNTPSLPTPNSVHPTSN